MYDDFVYKDSIICARDEASGKISIEAFKQHTHTQTFYYRIRRSNMTYETKNITFHVICVKVSSKSVERQAQHRPHRLKKPRTGSVRPRPSTETQTSVKEGRFGAETGRPLGKIFRKEYILGVNVGAL